MIAGVVRETIDTGVSVWAQVNTLNGPRTVLLDRMDAARAISPGDRLEWSNGDAWWMPACAAGQRYKLRRIGPIDPPRPAARPLTTVTESPE